ncbi:unnamed protein product [Ambrosiozyma monospora]|uniref:Unnamed protein product n=1 Tax=Ambrosiozyma monospora TaxID=43982 RepID=A0ACB5TJA8_AMBMO|nr:unnamed protein product [Ambrosiozyma monospora]
MGVQIVISNTGSGSGSGIGGLRSSNVDSNNSIDSDSYTALHAPGLRDDFYSNIVCWAKTSDNLAVGLGCTTHVWLDGGQNVSMESLISELISCVSYNDEDILVCGTKTGRLILYAPGSLRVNFTSILKASTGICCICWIPGSRIFFAGDDMGDVSLYEVGEDVEEETGMRQLHISLLKIFKCNEQQICGMSISSDAKQLTIGGNDNCCTIWDITNPLSPILKFFLPHDAAVKAIAYCPWVPNLLATGGGSNDRHIRFWHTGTGTLITKKLTRKQVTSLIWSRSKKELMATFGYGRVPSETSSLLNVYSYPSLKVVKQIPTGMNMNLRILSADISKRSDRVL